MSNSDSVPPSVNRVRDRKPVSLRDAAYQEIKRRIITCEYAPGECINEAAVSSALGFGRTPVHQALDRLMLEEMVEVIPRKGVIIKPIVMQDVLELIEVRKVNEVHCARLAAQYANNAQIAELASVVEAAQNAVGRRDINALMTLDGQFHNLLAEITRNFELAEVVKRLNERSLRFWFISFTTPTHHSDFQRQHERIFLAVRNHDADEAEAAMQEHIESFRRSVARQL